MNPFSVPTDAGPALRGAVVRPGDAAYDALRRVHSPTVDRRPALIAEVADAYDVAECLAYARGRDLEVAVRAGGHTPFGVGDGALVVDLRALDAIAVDAATGRVRVGGGVLGGPLDDALAAHGLAVTGPRFPTVGVAGFTLGSGSGWLERALGLASDRLRSATVVTADGRVVTASAREHADLFWALHGGGGNFGVVTELELEAAPLRDVVAGLRAYPVARLREVAAAYADVMAGAPDALCGGLVVRCPPGAADPVVVVVVLWAGDPAGAEAGIAPLAALGDPLMDTVGTMTYAQFGRLLLPPPEALAVPVRSHVRFGVLDALGAAPIAVLDELAGELCTKTSMLMLQPLGGALARATADESALGDRDAAWAFQLVTSWTDPADDAANTAWTRAAGAELLEHGRPSSWPNFVTEEPRRRLAVPYAPATLDRLRQTKRTWDPDTLFRAGHAIPPSPQVRPL